MSGLAKLCYNWCEISRFVRKPAMTKDENTFDLTINNKGETSLHVPAEMMIEILGPHSKRIMQERQGSQSTKRNGPGA